MPTLKKPQNNLASGVSNFVFRCKMNVKERWEKWIPWEWAARKGLGDSIHFLCHATTYEKPQHLSHLFPILKPGDIDSVLRNISKKYKVISTEEYAERVQRNKLKEKKVLATVTCDDGLREFKTYLWPMMKKHSIPCTLFLVKNFVEQKEYYYRFKTSLIIDRFDDESAFEQAQDCLSAFGKSVTSKISLKRMLLRMHNPGDFWLLDELAKALGISFSAYFKENRPFLDHNEIIELNNAGVRLGSHGVSHFRYDFLLKQKIEEDILDGVAYIQQLSGQNTVEHAFPFFGKTISREFLHTILRRQSVLTHFFDTGGICRDVPFVTHRIILDSVNPRNALRQAAYRYLHPS
jgi:peptidoglycan/xylan/chitin deacetylase (PgdA/CDA1 family)